LLTGRPIKDALEKMQETFCFQPEKLFAVTYRKRKRGWGPELILIIGANPSPNPKDPWQKPGGRRKGAFSTVGFFPCPVPPDSLKNSIFATTFSQIGMSFAKIRFTFVKILFTSSKIPVNFLKIPATFVKIAQTLSKIVSTLP